MNNTLRTALINYAVADFKTFAAFGRNEAAKAHLDVTEFGNVLNAKLDKISAKGKLGPKGWAKLRQACPSQAQRYFAVLYRGGTGPDLTTDDGLTLFVSTARNLARQAGKVVSQQESGLVDALVASLGEESEEAEDEEAA